MHVGVEVGAVGEAERIGRDPSTKVGTIIAFAKVDKPGFGISALAGKTPGVCSWR